MTRHKHIGEKKHKLMNLAKRVYKLVKRGKRDGTVERKNEMHYSCNKTNKAAIHKILSKIKRRLLKHILRL